MRVYTHKNIKVCQPQHQRQQKRINKEINKIRKSDFGPFQVGPTRISRAC